MPFRMPPPAQHHSSLAPPSAPVTSTTGTLRLPAPPLPPKPLHLTMSVRGRAAAFESGTVRGGWDKEGQDDGARGTTRNRSDGRKSGRSEKGRRPGMPRWSIAGGEEDGEEEEDDGGGTVKAKPAARGGEQDEEQEAKAALTSLARIFADDDQATNLDEPVHRSEATTSSTDGEGGSGIYRTPVGTLRALNPLTTAGSGSTVTMKRASTIKVRGKDGRLSIFFDATRENPFVPSFPEVEAFPEDDKPVSAAASISSDSEVSTPSHSPTPPSPSRSSAAVDESDTDSFLLPLPASSSPAVALHAFTGEPSFGELTFPGGVALRIEVEDLGGGWSLGFVEEEGEEGRGLIPRGWYAYVDLPPQPASPPPDRSPSPTPEAASETVPSSPAIFDKLVGLAFDPPVDIADPASHATLPSTPPEPPTFAALASPPSHPVHLSTDPSTTDLEAPHSPSSPIATSDPFPSSPPTTEDLPEPASPYPTRSIGRHVVVSGIEFEPIPGTPKVEEEGFDYSTATGGAGEEEEELSVEELLRREEEGAFEDARRVAETDEVVDGAVEQQDKAEEAKQPEGDGLLSSLSTSSPASTSSPVAPPPLLSTPPSIALVATPPRPPQPTGSLLFRLGLTSSPSSTYPSLSFPLSLPLPRPGRTTIPGATILAATGAAPSSSPKKKRLPRPEDGAGRGRLGVTVGGKDALLKWIEEGDELDEEVKDGEEGVQVWDVEAGPAWKPLSEPFLVHIHSPVKLSPLNGTPYTVYSLTTVFASPPISSSSASTGSTEGAHDEHDPAAGAETSLSLTVQRRYSHFQALHTLLSHRFFSPLISLPDLPPKVLGAARFSEEAVEQRRRDLERWVGRLVRHPVVGESEELRGFLAIEGEKELLAHLLLARPASPAPPLPLFPARVFHPAFNIDLDEAKELGERFERWCRATEVGRGMREVERAIGKGREGGRASANDLRSLAHSLIRLAGGLALPPPSHDKPPSPEDDTPLSNESDVAKQQRRAREWGLQNRQGGMGWKQEDGDALCLAKAVQASAEAMASIADLQNEAARTAFLGVQEILHEQSQPLTQYSPLIDLHSTLLQTYRRLSRLSSSSLSASDALSRCETALNITCAEMERIRVEFNEDVRRVMEGWLDAAVEVQEQTLAHLRYARDHFSPTSYPSLALTGPRLRSPLEAFSTSPVYPPLPQPTNATAMGRVSGTVAAVGSVFLAGAATTAGGGRATQPIKGGLRRAHTVNGAVGGGSGLGAGRRTGALLEEEEEDDEGETEGRGVTTWRDSILGGTMRLWQ